MQEEVRIKVRVELRLPVEKIGAKEKVLEVKLEKKNSVLELLRSIGRMYPSFERNFLVGLRTGEEKVSYFLVLVDDTLACTEDMLEEGDSVEIHPIVGGG